MMTYAVYNFILFGATISAYLYEKAQSKSQQTVFYFFAFFIPFFFLAIRYDIGTDYQSYVEYFYRIARGEIIPKEPGYLLINYGISKLGLSYQWVFVFFGFFTFFFAYKALPRDGFAIGVFLFMTTMYLYEGFSAIRQGLAIAIMAYAIRYIYEQRFWRYVLWAVVAMQFHLMTGLVLLLAYPLVRKRFNYIFLIGLIVVLFVLVRYTSIAENTLQAVVSLVPKYAWYINSQFIDAAKVSSGLGVLFKVAIAVTVVFFKDRIEIKYPQANIVINLYVLYTIFLIFHLKISIFMRVEHIFIFPMILSIIFFLKTFDQSSQVIIVLVIGAIFYVFFMKYIATGTLTIDNDVYVNPYQTIFGRI